MLPGQLAAGRGESLCESAQPCALLQGAGEFIGAVVAHTQADEVVRDPEVDLGVPGPAVPEDVGGGFPHHQAQEVAGGLREVGRDGRGIDGRPRVDVCRGKHPGRFGEILPLLPLIYLVVNQIGKPRGTWPVLGAGLVAVFALPVQDVVAPSTVLVACALVFLIWGAVCGTPHGRATFGAQAAGALVFGGLVIAGPAVDPELGRCLVAAGWFLHGVWDFVHLWLDKVVARTFAEWCGVVDVLVAAQLLFIV